MATSSRIKVGQLSERQQYTKLTAYIDNVFQVSPYASDQVQALSASRSEQIKAVVKRAFETTDASKPANASDTAPSGLQVSTSSLKASTSKSATSSKNLSSAAAFVRSARASSQKLWYLSLIEVLSERRRTSTSSLASTLHARNPELLRVKSRRQVVRLILKAQAEGAPIVWADESGGSVKLKPGRPAASAPQPSSMVDYDEAKPDEPVATEAERSSNGVNASEVLLDSHKQSTAAGSNVVLEASGNVEESAMELNDLTQESLEDASDSETIMDLSRSVDHEDTSDTSSQAGSETGSSEGYATADTSVDTSSDANNDSTSLDLPELKSEWTRSGSLQPSQDHASAQIASSSAGSSTNATSRSQAISAQYPLNYLKYESLLDVLATNCDEDGEIFAVEALAALYEHDRAYFNANPFIKYLVRNCQRDGYPIEWREATNSDDSIIQLKLTKAELAELRRLPKPRPNKSAALHARVQTLRRGS